MKSSEVIRRLNEIPSEDIECQVLIDKRFTKLDNLWFLDREDGAVAVFSPVETEKPKLQLFKVEYGNGWLGSRNNCGTELVLAVNRKEAREILSSELNVKLGHIGKTQLIEYLQ